MTTRPLTGLLVLLLAAAAAACGDPPVTARDNADVDEPWGRTFLSTSVTEGGEPRPLVAGTEIRLTFFDDHRLGASAGCNIMGGQAEVSDGRLVVADLSTTEMGCDPPRHEQDEWLAGFLTARPAWRLDGAALTLTGGGTEIRLEDREVADPDRPLRGTRWVVDTVVDGDAASSVPPDADAHVTFGGGGEGGGDGFGGSTGCNSMSGTATADGDDALVFSDVITTKMACDADRMRLEEAVLTVLDGRVSYRIEADVLTLDHPSGKGLRLRAGG